MASLPARLIVPAVLLVAGCSASGGTRAPPSPPQAPPSLRPARQAYEAGRYGEAADLYQRAAGEAPAYAPAFLGWGRAHLQLAVQEERPLTRTEHAQRAVVALTHAIRIDPLLKDAYINRALAYVHLRRHENAVRDLLHVVELLDPQDPSAQLFLAQIYFEKYDGMEAQALERYERYLALGGGDPEARQRVEYLRRFHAAGPSQPPAPPPATGSAPPRDREREAEELLSRAVIALGGGRRDEVVELARRLLDEYADTAFVRRQREAIERLVEEALRQP